MARRKPTEEDLARRQVLAKEWIDFREEFIFTQIRLAETLGLSRRTVQMVESGKISPHPETLRKFNALAATHRNEKKRKKKGEPSWQK